MPTGEPHPMDLVCHKNPGRTLRTPRVHTRLHWSTLPAEFVSPRLAHPFIALGSLQRGGRQYSFTSEIYSPGVTCRQDCPSVRLVADSRHDRRERMTPPPNSGLDGVQCLVRVRIGGPTHRRADVHNLRLARTAMEWDWNWPDD